MRQEEDDSDGDYQDSLPPPDENRPRTRPDVTPLMRQVVREEVRALLDLHPYQPEEQDEDEVAVGNAARARGPRSYQRADDRDEEEVTVGYAAWTSSLPTCR